jgi:hypothetical protein
MPRSKKPVSQKQLTAAEFAVLRLEDLQAVANLKAGLVAVFQPLNAQKLFALERIALAQQALLRAARLETGLFTACLNQALDPAGPPLILMTKELTGDLEVTRAQNRSYAAPKTRPRSGSRGVLNGF